MRRLVPRSGLLVAVCTGAAMVAGAVHGLVGVDAELERSALAAREHRAAERVHVLMLVREHGRYCRERDPRI